MRDSLKFLLCVYQHFDTVFLHQAAKSVKIVIPIEKTVSGVFDDYEIDIASFCSGAPGEGSE